MNLVFSSSCSTSPGEAHASSSGPRRRAGPAAPHANRVGTPVSFRLGSTLRREEEYGMMTDQGGYEGSAGRLSELSVALQQCRAQAMDCLGRCRCRGSHTEMGGTFPADMRNVESGLRLLVLCPHWDRNQNLLVAGHCHSWPVRSPLHTPTRLHSYTRTKTATSDIRAAQRPHLKGCVALPLQAVRGPTVTSRREAPARAAAARMGGSALTQSGHQGRPVLGSGRREREAGLRGAAALQGGSVRGTGRKDICYRQRD